MLDERRSISRPAGWFCVAWSADLPAGAQPRPIHYFDTEMVIYRGESGRVVVFDAYCAHMGAHLGVGGHVKGDDIVCPYHAWRWDTAGEVAEIPYSSRINRSRRLRSWPVHESDGAIFVWNDERGADPEWDPPRLEVLASAHDPRVRSEFRFDSVRMAPQMLLEAAVDRSHSASAYGVDLAAPELKADGPVLRVSYRANGSSSAEVASVHSWGTGIVTVALSEPEPHVVVSLVVPVDKEHSELRSVVVHTGEGLESSAFSDLVKRRWSRLDLDISIWENQRWSRAGSTDLDEPEWEQIYRWADQFYGPAAGSEDKEGF